MEWEGVEKIIFYPEQEKVELHFPAPMPPGGGSARIEKAKRIGINRIDVFHALIEKDRVEINFRFVASCEVKDDTLICKSQIGKGELYEDLKEDLEKLRREYGIPRTTWKEVLSDISWIL